MDVVKSYAKINLGLSVVKKTKKNYHKLKMVMSQIELYDEICFGECNDLIVLSDKEICEMCDNLCYKVALYLKQKYKVDSGVKIYIKKNIPDGGGLGGGSSNAAAVLKYLNSYWGLNLSQTKLKKIGFKFGCDIPFFITEDISYVYSYGEKVRPLKVVPQNADVLLIIPQYKNSTKVIFENHIIEKRNNKKIKTLIESLKEGEFVPKVYNDLEKTVNYVTNNEHSNLVSMLRKMGFENVAMSGSGSTIVVYLNKGDNASEMIEIIKKNILVSGVIASKLKMYS